MKWYVKLSILLISLILIIIITLFNTNIIFALNGEDTLLINYGQLYVESGFEANVFNHNLSDKVEVTTDLNVSVLGEYNINYNLNYLNKEYNLVRKIKVIDNEKPMITLNGEKDITLYVNDEYKELGVTAIDNYDGDISNKVIITGNVDTSKVGEYNLVYSVVDSSGNMSSTSRNVKVINRVVNTFVTDEGYNDNNNEIVKYINDKGYNVSIGYYNLVNGNSFYYKENKIYYGASLIKSLLSIYMYENNLVNDSNRYDMEKMISVSNNDSYFNLLYSVGIDNLRNYGYSLGTKYTLSGPDDFGMTNVMDQMVIFKKLYSMVKDNKYNEMKSYFINDYFNSLKINDNVVMHKYGYWDGIYHDCGIIFDREPYILIVLTTHGLDNYRDIVNDISNSMYNYHINNL